MASASTRRVPQGEVINEFADGGSYIQSKMETAVLDLERKRIARDNEKAAAKAMESMNVSAPSGSSKSEDVALIVSQLGCTNQEAQQALAANKGDLVATLIKMVQPRARAKSVDGGGEVKA